MPVVPMKNLLEAGVHFGHQTRSWNPKMKPYIFSARNGIHILNLENTEKLVDSAYEFIRNIAMSGKRVLFVGTKKQAANVIKEEATRCSEFFVNSRWLGGTLTNFKTIRQSVSRLARIDLQVKSGELNMLTKKEQAKILSEKEKLDTNLGGIKEMLDMPGCLFVVDPNTERNAVLEAKRLGIPVVAICDTNCDPSNITKIIAANDDAISSVKLITSAMADAIIEAKSALGKDEQVVKTEKEQPKVVEMTLSDFGITEETK